MNRNTAKERLTPPDKPKGVPWVLLALAFGLFIIGGSFMTSRRASYLSYYLNWFHWPYWYSVNLWILAVGASVNRFIQKKKARNIVLAAVLGSVFIVTALNSAWLHALAYRAFCLLESFHYSVFRPYFYAPITELFSSGSLSGRLFVAPGSAFGLIVVLLVCRYAIRRNRNGKTEIPKE